MTAFDEDGAMNTADALAALEEADFHADAQDRRIRLDIKRRLKLAGLESDLAAINDITVLRQLLIQQVSYQEGQRVEVQLPQANDWREGSIEGVNVRYAEEDFDRVAVKLWDGSTYCALPERVRPAEEESPLWEPSAGIRPDDSTIPASEWISPFPQEPASVECTCPAQGIGPDWIEIPGTVSGLLHLRSCPRSQGARPRGGWEEPDPEMVGPFPVEPPPGSPEAVAQAAETIRAPLHPDPDNPDEPAMCRWCDRPAVILNSVCRKPACAYHEDDSSAPHPIPYAAIVRQRDKLAADLETSRLLCGRLADALEVALSAIESLNLAAWQRCGHDSTVYREMTGVPSLADAASLIRESLRKAGRS